MRNVKVTDITLKKLGGSSEVSLLFREKAAIAACAAALGVDAVELAPVKNLREDGIIYKTIAQKVKNATLAIPVGFTVSSVVDAFECIKSAGNPRLQVELPVSTVQMEYIYHLKSDKMLAKIGELVKAAKGLTEDVEFAALDATRADEDFLIAAAKEAVEKGATLVTLCDDAGISLPESIAALAEKVKAAVDVPVYIQTSDKISMAVSSAITCIAKGIDGVKCAMAGKDVLLTGKLSDALKVCGAEIDAQSNLDGTKIHTSIEDMLSSISHQVYTDETVSESKKILLDSDCSIAQVAQTAAVLGYDLSEVDCGNVHKALIKVCEKKGAIGAKEFDALVASYAMQAPSTYHLESYTTTCSNVTSSMSQVTLKCGGELIYGVSMGDGAVDSAFRAIEQCIGHHYELDDFQIQAVTEGKDALGSALVKLRNNGKLYSGNGISTDIVAASIRAYINALNKIVFEEE